MEPVDLADIKRHLVLDADDNSLDSNLTSMLVAARRAIEHRIRRTVVGEDRELVLEAFPDSAPVQLLGWLGSNSPAAAIPGASDVSLSGGSVTAAEVTYYDGAGIEQVLDAAEFYAALDRLPAILRPIGAWPATQPRPDAVRIAYTMSPMDGGDLDMVRHAIRLIVGHWHANREAVATDARGGNMELPISVSFLLDPLVQFASD